MVKAVRAAWLSMLAGGALLVVTARYLPDPAGATIWLLISLGAMAVASYAVARGDAVHRSGWWILLASLAAGAAGGVLYVVPAGDLSQWAWVTALAVRGALFSVGMVVLVGVRRAHTTVENMLDAGIVFAALAIGVWVLLGGPSRGTPPDSSAELVFGLIFAGLDLVLLACVVRIALDSRGRTPAVLLLAGCALVVLASDMICVPRLFGSGPDQFQPGGLVHLAWQISGAGLAAVTLHPSFSVGYLTPDRDGSWRVDAADTLPRLRLATFIMIALFTPLLPIVPVLGARHQMPHGVLVMLTGTPVLTALLVVLLVVRLGLVARLATGRAVAMKVQAAALLVQATALRGALAEQQQLQHQLSHHALHDPLTGLANRVLLVGRLEVLLADPGRRPGALLLLDLDGFKDVNDTLGHPAGDDLLVEVGNRLRTTTGSAGTVARLGGDEFAVLMTDAGPERCRQLSHRLVASLREVFPLAERQVYLAASGGLLLLAAQQTGAQAGADGGARVTQAAQALRDADLALYAAKESGKNRVMEFDPGMRESRLRYSALASAVRAALSNNALTLRYQPIVELSSGRPVALEALLRWRGEDGRPVPPSQFVEVAEEIGLIMEIGARVLRDACGRAARWHDRHGVSLSVNISGRQLVTPGFAEQVLAVLEDTALPARALILEITETVLVEANGAGGAMAADSLDRLRQAGVRIAVDDFGTGYSSLSYLHRLPIDMLKFDRAFTSTLDSSGERGALFVGAILGLGAGLGVPTVGEGVETPRQAELLRELECPLAQGYHFALPATAEWVDTYLAERCPSNSVQRL